MKFVSRSTYKEAFRKAPSPGSETVPEYILEKDKRGVESLRQCGERPIYKLIQESSRGISVRSIMERFMSGDTSVVGEISSSDFADVTSLPSSFLEAQNRLAKATQLFEGLPINVRNAYGSNVNAFLAACSDGSFYKRFGIETGMIKVAKKPVDHGSNITKELKSISDKLVTGGDSNA